MWKPRIVGDSTLRVKVVPDLRENERRAVRRAAVVAVGFAAAVMVVTLVGVALATWIGRGEARAGIAASYSSPDELPTCGSVGDLAAPDGVTATVKPTAAPGEYVGVRLQVASGSVTPQPLSVVVARGTDIVGEYRGTAPSDPSAVVLAGCSANSAADTNPTVPGGRPLLPPGDYDLVVVFGEALPPGDERVYRPPITALRMPLTVVAETPR